MHPHSDLHMSWLLCSVHCDASSLFKAALDCRRAEIKSHFHWGESLQKPSALTACSLHIWYDAEHPVTHPASEEDVSVFRPHCVCLLYCRTLAALHRDSSVFLMFREASLACSTSLQPRCSNRCLLFSNKPRESRPRVESVGRWVEELCFCQLEDHRSYFFTNTLEGGEGGGLKNRNLWERQKAFCRDDEALPTQQWYFLCLCRPRSVCPPLSSSTHLLILSSNPAYVIISSRWRWPRFPAMTRHAEEQRAIHQNICLNVILRTSS